MKTLTPSLSSGELMISRNFFGTNDDTGDESSGFVETKDADGPVAVDLTGKKKRWFHVIFAGSSVWRIFGENSDGIAVGIRGKDDGFWEHDDWFLLYDPGRTCERR